MVFNDGMKRKSILFTMEQLELRKQLATTVGIINNRCDVITIDDNIRIKVRHCKLLRRSKTNQFHWEFKHLIHNDFKANNMSIDYYALAGFDVKCKDVVKAWIISADNVMLKRSNMIFISQDDRTEYTTYELEIL